MQTLYCQDNSHKYPYTIQMNCIHDDSIASACHSLANSFIFICDQRITKQYAHPVINQFKQRGLTCELITLPSGEEHKTRETKQIIEDKMLALGCGRDTTIIAIGGGVTTDLAGFIAATYCRGIPSVYIPTTLLGMVDASIGGKTAVNTPHGKNLIGSFHPPTHVFCDPNVLRSLKHDQLLDGLAETIKHALIQDAVLFDHINDLLDQTTVDNITLDQWEWIIQKSAGIKNMIVSQDATETKGPRQLLNFGHTVAHSIEKLTQYQYSHGQTVMIGLLAESHLSFLEGRLSEPELNRIEILLAKLNYNHSIQLSEKDIPSLISNMQLDKKTINKTPHFVLLNSIGQAHIDGNAHSFPCSEEHIRLSLIETIKELAL